MKKMPEISIIVANYNNAKYLDDCLASVATQSFADFECIIIDDGSADDSKKIINRWLKKDKRFVAYFQKNSGVSAARNRGIDMARGKYIAFLDSDDCFCPGAIGVLYDLIEQNHADIAGGGGVIVDEDFSLSRCPNNINYANMPFQLFSNTVDDMIEMSKMGGQYRFVWVWRRLFRRECIGNVRFDEKLYPGEDTCFMFEIIPHAPRIVESTTMVVYHRFSKNCISRTDFNQEKFAWIVPTLCRLREIMDKYYHPVFQKWFYKGYGLLVLQETVYKSIGFGRMMHQVADMLRPIYGTRVFPTKYLSLRKRLILWLFLKVF
ncbi:MAG: glycosyltransferase [Alphaproteobacteria bacterium]|nr:glycosyltransferase [Alphaproteobacteria bacterium]